MSDPKSILLLTGTFQPMKKRRSCWDLDKDKVAAAEAILRESRTLSRDPERLLRTVAEGKPVRLPRRCDLGVVASLFEPLSRGDHAGSPSRPTPGSSAPS